MDFQSIPLQILLSLLVIILVFIAIPMMAGTTLQIKKDDALKLSGIKSAPSTNFIDQFFKRSEIYRCIKDTVNMKKDPGFVYTFAPLSQYSINTFKNLGYQVYLKKRDILTDEYYIIWGDKVNIEPDWEKL
jgi:hypothetical protein